MSNDASDSDLVELTSMEPLRIGNDSGGGFGPEFDGSIGGVDVSGEILGSGADGDYDRALGRFMRNEIDYDEFMKLTGGQTLEEEMAADGGGESIEDEDDEEFPNADTTQEFAVKKEFVSEYGGDLPVHVRNLMQEVIRQEPRNAASYRQVSDIYQELGDPQKSLQYGLLAAHLDSRTPAEDWAHWGDESKKLELIEEAAACYGRAIRLNPSNWKYYENRIEMLDLLGLRPLAMRTRLQAAQMIDPSQAGVDFEWFHELIKTPLKAILLSRDLLAHEDEPHVLEIARAYYNCDAFKTTKQFLETLQEWNNYCDNPEMWFIYGNTAAALKDVTTAMESFEKVLQLNPGHVDARINLSGLQQKMGQSDRALETLQDYDLDTCTHLPDERLLIRQADVLFDSQKTEQFIRCCRMLLTPHFYEVHRNQDSIGKRRSSKTGFFLSNTLRVAAINAITNTNWEKFVRRLGSAAANERRSADELDPALSPGNHALQAISGNNSLITGSYRHALGEYLRVWNDNKKNPMICLLLALTFTHMACKKDISSRHMIAVRGIAFMKSYEKNRACRQECYYNIGRMFHQLSLTPLAIHFYNKVLSEPPPRVFYTDDEGNEVERPSDMYDVRRFAAHNLALIYRASGNDYLARRIYEKYLVV
ncbi:tetratricopeptide repeat protein [Teladorsagia circumcincta]|uniref:Tetratricopeptide repeat protein n=1 Tax=Teladorsagia circumcincta TaxID=45464 RepID=A0A2G9V581_TELCI|nr:tetratricopeptide repeat protein [Teladorsagia circumcincta]